MKNVIDDRGVLKYHALRERAYAQWHALKRKYHESDRHNHQTVLD